MLGSPRDAAQRRSWALDAPRRSCEQTSGRRGAEWLLGSGRVTAAQSLWSPTVVSKEDIGERGEGETPQREGCG